MKVILIIIIGLFPILGMGQEVIDSLPSDQVEVLKRFNASLEKSQKIRFSPLPVATDSTPRSYQYNLLLRESRIIPEKAKFRYTELRFDDLFDPYHGFMKLGYGYPNFPYALLSYGQNDPANYQWNAFIEHRSYHKDLAFQDYSQTNGKASAQVRISEDWQAGGELGVLSNSYQYFPLKEDSLYEEGDAKRAWLSIAPQVHLDGYIGSWKSETNLKFQFDKDDQGPKQQKGNLNTSFSRIIDQSAAFQFDLQGQLGQINFDSTDVELNFVQLGGSWQKLWHAGTARIGASVVFGEEIALLPDVHLQFNIVGQKLSAYAGASGKAGPLDLQIIYNENPFYNFQNSFKAFQRSYDFYGGIAGRANQLIYDLRVSYGLQNNAHFFLNDSINEHLFNIYLDDLKRLSFIGDVRFLINSESHIGILGKQHFFTLDKLEQAYHRPTYDLSLYASSKVLNNKLLIAGDITILGNAAYLEETSSLFLDPILNLNIQLGYKLNESWSLFLEGSNVLNQKYQRFFMYEDIGARIVGGIIYKL